MTHEADWISAHAFYQDHLDPLLVDVVRPLTDDLARGGLAHGSFFLRYWDGGPHLRLRVLPASPTCRSEVERRIVQRLDEFFAAHPSPDRLTAAEYADMARTVAGWEDTGYARELHPNNSVSFAEYRRETHKYGDGESVCAVERHFVESSEIAMDILRAAPTPDQRVQAAYAMLVLAWFVAEPQPAVLRQWITMSTSDAPPDAGAVLLARQMRLLAGRSNEAGPGSLASWARSVAVLRKELLALTGAGLYAPPAQGWDGPHGARSTQGSVLTVIDICAHLICNRLGVTMDVEAGVRGQALRAMSVILGEA